MNNTNLTCDFSKKKKRVYIEVGRGIFDRSGGIEVLGAEHRGPCTHRSP